MKPKPAEPGYWEAFARDLGWDAARVVEAGRVGSLAVERGMTPDEALDVVVARVRDGRPVRIGPTPFATLVRNEGVPALAAGILAFLSVGVGRTGESAASLFPIYFTGLIATAIALAVRGLVRRRWRLSSLGLLVTAAAFVLFVRM
jgi:hypothetical protein